MLIGREGRSYGMRVLQIVCVFLKAFGPYCLAVVLAGHILSSCPEHVLITGTEELRCMLGLLELNQSHGFTMGLKA